MDGWLIFEIVIIAGLFSAFWVKSDMFFNFVIALWLAFLIIDPHGIYAVVRYVGILVSIITLTGVFEDDDGKRSYRKPD